MAVLAERVGVAGWFTTLIVLLVVDARLNRAFVLLHYAFQVLLAVDIGN